MNLYPLFRSALFKRDPEWSHDFTLNQLERMGKGPMRFLLQQKLPSKPVELLGMYFPNPVGLAAGLDKDARCIDAFDAMGFGFIEVGTVTPRPQAGNPKPRMFRLPEHQALINRMGFNNQGVDALVERIKGSKYKGVLGINIGKNKDTSEAEGTADYLYCMERVYPLASYIAVNISSPNTPGLRAFQHGDVLDQLLSALKAKQAELTETYGKYVPIMVKIAPDMDQAQTKGFADAIQRHGIDGVIATNTTVERTAISGHLHAQEAGGLSGAPVTEASTQVIRWLRAALPKSTPIIGVGGIMNATDAKSKIDAGASLVQVYTGFIYRGPELIREIVENL
ncbi:quinone-dependent dihydroorotate dehydrogenase [Aliidiomarina halalkaliphila]|uniref:Dihydroorotate dehydrogenase (quinone) n=1 Tax=Aliidiomarina halalkaliphila TaxID=2593535 RepID=A0A552X3Y0_9GAMM|nr:quinone-dependent dihydroorotate dehydrogenase [Aliidiomarina halalkaliphila]TRW49731.1 quinone-dependent dihydroorotate dehydrogenase [Aliidiomarina halalkaliphila]